MRDTILRRNVDWVKLTEDMSESEYKYKYYKNIYNVYKELYKIKQEFKAKNVIAVNNFTDWYGDLGLEAETDCVIIREGSKDILNVESLPIEVYVSVKDGELEKLSILDNLDMKLSKLSESFDKTLEHKERLDLLNIELHQLAIDIYEFMFDMKEEDRDFIFDVVFYWKGNKELKGLLHEFIQYALKHAKDYYSEEYLADAILISLGFLDEIKIICLLEGFNKVDELLSPDKFNIKNLSELVDKYKVKKEELDIRQLRKI